MKNKVKLLIILLTFFLFLGNVKAYDENSRFTSREIDKVGDSIKFGKGITDIEKSYDARIYSVNDGKRDYYAYCLDPGINAAPHLKVDHILMYSNSTTPAQDYGMLTIMQNGAADYKSGNINKEEYEATMIALRMFANGIAGWRYVYDGNTYFPSLIKTLYEWVRDDADLTELYKQFNTAAPKPKYILERYNYYKRYETEYKNYYFTVKSTVADKAKELVKKGLQATVDYMHGDIVNPTVTEGLQGIIDINNSGGMITKMVVMTLKPKDFENDDYSKSELKYLGFTNNSVSNVKYLGYSTKYSTKESDYNSGSLDGVNILEYLNKQKADALYIAYEVTIATSKIDSEGCSSVFSVNYTYNDPKLINGAILLSSNDAGEDFSELQRFAMYSSGAVEKSVKLDAHICSGYCEPEMELPEICEDGTATDSSGYVTYSYREGVSKGQEKIDKCVIGSKDVGDNSLQLIDGKYAAAIKNNRYCAVYCRESFNFHMPYKIDNVASGRYFQIGIKIDAQEDCYLSELDREKFYSEVASIQESAIAAYTEYAINKAKGDAKVTEVSSGCKNVGDELEDGTKKVTKVWSIEIPGYKTCSSSRGSEGQVTASCTQVSGQTIYAYTTEKVTSATGTSLKPSEGSSSTKIEFVESFGGGGGGGVPHHSTGKTHKSTSDRGPVGPALATTECREVTDIKIVNTEITNSQIYASSALTTVQNSEYDVTSLIDELNACIYDWDLVYDFNPEVKYNYDEPEPGNTEVTKWIEAVKNIDADKMVTVSKEVKSAKCAEGTEKYCKVVDKFKSIDGEDIEASRYCSKLSNKETYECADRFNNSNHYSMKSYTFCTENGCTKGSYEVTEINFVHKIATANVELDTKRVYYSLHDRGQIIVRETKPKNINADVVDGLPVAASTPKGTYYYIISLDKIGNYYSTGETGRVYGTKKTSISYVLGDSNVLTLNGDEIRQNEYACIYEVNEPPTTNYCTNEETGEVHNLDTECADYDDQAKCKQDLCPSDGTGGNYCTNEETGEIHNLDTECADYDNQAKCKQELCPSDGTGGNYCTNEETGEVHNLDTECDGYKDKATCRKSKCPSNIKKNYCVKGAEGYYVCETQSLDSSCVKKDTREAAISEAKENYNCCPECTVVCVGTCLYDIPGHDLGKLLVDFRTITPAKVNPNNRKLGYNWDVNNESNPLVAKKAQNTITEIEARANIDVDTVNVKKVSDYTFKVNMTPAVANWVKSYNGRAEKNGSYNSNTMKCYDYTLSDFDENACKKAGYTWEKNSCKMTNIFCYSTFIDELIEDFPEQVDAKNRQAAKEGATSNFKAYQNLTLPNKDTKIITNDYWTIYIYTELDVNGDGIPDIGPSWK